jgi:hypothetical protein
VVVSDGNGGADSNTGRFVVNRYMINDKLNSLKGGKLSGDASDCGVGCQDADLQNSLMSEIELGQGSGGRMGS